MTKSRDWRQAMRTVIVPLISVVMAIFVGSLVILAIGYNPIQAYGELLRGAFGTPVAVTITLSKSVPLILSGLAVALAFKCSVFNIGVEGQLMMGAMAAGIFGVQVALPGILHVPFVLIMSMAFGVLWAVVPALLKLKANVNVVISTIMFNYVATFLTQFLIMGPFKGDSAAAATHAIHNSARLPALLPKPFKLNLGFLLAILMVFAVYIFLNKTKRGYEMKAVGLSPTASHYQGINYQQNMFLALLISGAISGLAGGIEVTGSLGKMVNGFSTGYGFTGIPVALMARNNPFAIILTGLFFGAMGSGSLRMQTSVGVSSDITSVIQALVIIFLCAEHVITYLIKKRAERKG